jgi:hypothetical protein
LLQDHDADWRNATTDHYATSSQGRTPQQRNIKWYVLNLPIQSKECSDVSQAPEPEILKRKRSRPSDWWAATPTTPQQDEPPAKKRGKPSSLDAEAKGIKDAPAAGNRGKNAKGKELLRDGENVEDELQEKPVRRGRSSGDRDELLGGLGTSKVRGKAKKGKSSQGLRESQSSPKKRGKPAAGQAEEQVEETIVEKAPLRKRGKPSVGRVEETAKEAEPVKESKSLRRGRSSNTEAEVRAGTESTAQAPDVPKRRGRRPAADKGVEPPVEGADEDPIAPPKRRWPAKRVEAEPPIDDFADDNSTRQKKKKRRSGAEILEAEYLALTTTEDYAKGRTQVPVTEPRTAPFTDDQKRHRKRIRRSDAQLEDVLPRASLPVDHQERGRTRTRRSDAELQDVAVARPSKQWKRSQQRDQSVQVEVASSKLVSGLSGLKNGVKPALEKHAKSARGSTVAEQSQNIKKRTRSSVTGGVPSVVSEPARTRKKGPKRQSEEEPKSHKHKNVESKFSYCFPV